MPMASNHGHVFTFLPLTTGCHHSIADGVRKKRELFVDYNSVIEKKINLYVLHRSYFEYGGK